MRTIILGVLLAVMQATPPVPRHAPNKRAPSSQNIQQQPEPENATPAPAESIQPSARTPIDQNGGTQPSKTNKPEAEVVAESTSVPVDSFWWNRFYVIFNGILVIIGAIGAGLAYRTLKGIESSGKQTDRMIEHAGTQALAVKTASEAALRNAVNVMNAERAWLSIFEIDTEFHTGVIGENAPSRTGIKFRMKRLNSGRTPAIRYHLSTGGQTVYPPYSSDPPIFLPPDSKDRPEAILLPGVHGYSRSPFFPQSDIEKLKDGKCMIYLYGLAVYDTVFSYSETKPATTEMLIKVEWYGINKDTRQPVFSFNQTKCSAS
jgi:hypothetical protein